MFHFSLLGDHGLQITFSETASEKVNQRIRNFIYVLEKYGKLPIKECIPAYNTLSIYYDATQISFDQLVEKMKELESISANNKSPVPHVHQIPTIYGGVYGPDLEEVAAYHQMTKEEVIQLHSSPTYLIYMLGFSPGFPYLGGMSPKIATPRLSNPRPLVCAGSVGIAGEQTGIYSIDSPGGWRIIGRTPTSLYNPENKNPFLLKSGDYIQFKPIDNVEYQLLMKQRGV